MDDLRQKLFPIFLNEAERNLAALRQFLSYENLAIATAEELETAFRAAHTLKGTANLVQAESICKIARRLEAMLEKHYEAGTVPTPVEHEALKLAVDWLAPLVSALQGDLQEPILFVAEALQALDLAEAFPGRTPLVELLDSQAEDRLPQLDDPFAGDPELVTDDEGLPDTAADPFADDPAFGMEIDLLADDPKVPGLAFGQDDPFADDDVFSTPEPVPEAEVETTESTETESVSREPIPFDPFAEDSLGLEVEGEFDVASPERVKEGAVDAATASEQIVESLVAEVDENVTAERAETTTETSVDDPFAEDSFDLGVGFDDDSAVVEMSDLTGVEFDEPLTAEDSGTEEVLTAEEKAVAADPFADDEDLTTEISDEDEGTASFVASPDAVAARAEEIAESLLLPDQQTAPRKDYACCVFKIAEHDYHLPIKQMQEIADLPQVVPLPLAPPMVSGLVNLRGQVLPVINLATLNQHQLSEVRVQRRLVVADYKGESLAFLADGVPYLSEEFNGEKIDMAKFLSLYRIRGVEE